MLKELGFYRGVNLGGWLSQCDYSEERMDSFIREEDFERIAEWGFDHVRLPVDYNVIQYPDGSMKEEGLERIDRAQEWCRKTGLHMVLDLHKAPGFSFDPHERENGFFSDLRTQARFYTIWESLASRYAGIADAMLFDLLNEVTEKEYLNPWMQIAEECLRRIRLHAPAANILIGSWNNNGVREVPDLCLLADGKIFYSFHCYEPHDYTHQGAYWEADRRDISGRIAYAESGVTAEYFEELLQPAIQKAEADGRELYCGEYGVIDVVPPEDAIGWFTAIHEVFEHHRIARCLWSWKEMDFGFADARMEAVRCRMLKLI